MPFETLDLPDLAQPTIAMLQTSSLTSAVQQALERMITLGEIGPGDKLNEAALAERLGVSRGPEREAIRVLAEAASEEQLDSLQAMIASMEQAVQAQDAALYYRLNVEFHETLVSFAGNRKMYLLYRRLTRELGLFRRRNLAAQDLLTGSIQEHREVLAAIRSRNAALAADTLRRHVLQSRERTARSQDVADAPAKVSN